MNTPTLAATHIDPALDRALRNFLAHARPRIVVETGTYLGLGTTLTICEALAENDLPDTKFFSIEANPDSYVQAWNNLGQRHFYPRLLRGLSVPRALAEAQGRSAAAPSQPGSAPPQPQCSPIAASWANGLDDLLGFVLRNHAPNFLLLDSAEELGFAEFQYAVGLLKAPCYIALVAVNGRKHQRSLQEMEADARFKLLEVSHEGQGFGLAHFTP